MRERSLVPAGLDLDLAHHVVVVMLLFSRLMTCRRSDESLAARLYCVVARRLCGPALSRGIRRPQSMSVGQWRVPPWTPSHTVIHRWGSNSGRPLLVDARSRLDSTADPAWWEHRPVAWVAFSVRVSWCSACSWPRLSSATLRGHNKPGALARPSPRAWRSSPAQCAIRPEAWHLCARLGARQC